MFLENDANLGFSRFLDEYEQYVQKTKARNQRPISILAYLVEMVQ